MAKIRPFSIYLLKEGFDHANSLKQEHSLEEAEAADLPDNARLFILDTPPRPPWWRSYFGIEQELHQASKGALVFLEIGGRNFAISFGHVYHHLNDYSYEYDFGLRVTLNSLERPALQRLLAEIRLSHPTRLTNHGNRAGKSGGKRTCE